jgi:hypothetical protein
MKIILTVTSIALFMAACNTNPKTTVSTTPLPDTTGLAQYQAWRAQQVQDSIALVNRSAQAAYGPAAAASGSRTTTSTAHRTSSGSGSSASRSTTMSSESSNTASRKKGWSKTAKGAVIGGVVGAGTGAVVNKKNRGAGAVIGGVLGAGAGAVIGHQKDKKDGRH